VRERERERMTKRRDLLQFQLLLPLFIHLYLVFFSLYIEEGKKSKIRKSENQKIRKSEAFNSISPTLNKCKGHQKAARRWKKMPGYIFLKKNNWYLGIQVERVGDNSDANHQMWGHVRAKDQASENRHHNHFYEKREKENKK
jgi:hypothetical protein